MFSFFIWLLYRCSFNKMQYATLFPTQSAIPTDLSRFNYPTCTSQNWQHMFNSNTGCIFTGWRHVYLSDTADNATSWLSQSSKQRSLLSAMQPASMWWLNPNIYSHICNEYLGKPQIFHVLNKMFSKKQVNFSKWHVIIWNTSPSLSLNFPAPIQLTSNAGFTHVYHSMRTDQGTRHGPLCTKLHANKPRIIYQRRSMVPWHQLLNKAWYDNSIKTAVMLLKSGT